MGSGDGVITAVCLLTSGCDGFQTFGLPGSGSADGGRVILSGSVDDNTLATSDSVNADLETSVTADAIGAQWGATAEMANRYGLGFTLTTQSVLHLMFTNQTREGRGIAGHYFFSLQGPDVLFSSEFNPSGEVFTLIPGAYALDVDYFTDQLGFSAVQGFFTHETFSNDLILNADFTPVVPEPIWTFVIPALLVVMALGVRRLRRRNRRALISS